MSAGGLFQAALGARERLHPWRRNLARFVRNGWRRQSCRASRRSDMDKVESFIFSVALFAAGMITLVTLPLA